MYVTVNILIDTYRVFDVFYVIRLLLYYFILFDDIKPYLLIYFYKTVDKKIVPPPLNSIEQASDCVHSNIGS